MDKIKRIINCIVPVKFCNFKCHYCYLGQENSFKAENTTLKYDLDHIQKAMSLERFGGPCMMNLCAVGETLLASYIVDLSKRLIENGHYVTIVTNGVTTKKIIEFSKFSDEEKKHLFIKFSYQFLELKRLNLINAFFDNIKIIKDAGISFSVELTANDESIPYIDELKEVCEKNTGAMPHIIESRDNNKGYMKLTKLDNKEHMKAWKKFKTPLITFQDKLWDEKRKEFCYAGDWVSTLYLENGDLSVCFGGGPHFQNIFEDIDEPIHFCAIGSKCPWEHCYAAYVLLTLGAIPELDTPKYSKLRNRITNNKEEWLTHEMKYFMSSKFKESNEEYNTDRKNIVNWYRSIELNGKSKNNDNFEKSIEKVLKNKKIKSVAIYGNDVFDKDLIERLNNTDIKIKYKLSPNCVQINKSLKSSLVHKSKYTLKKIIRPTEIPVLNCCDSLPKVDAIIVTDMYNFGKIKKKLKKIVETEVILLTNIDN